MSDPNRNRREYKWAISEERRQELNRERYEHMRRGREAKRSERKAVNTPVTEAKDSQ